MPAVTPTIASGESVGALNLKGLRHERFPFASIANADTFASGINSVVAYAIFSATKAVYATQTSGTFTFTVTSGPVTDAVLHIFCQDY